MSGRSESLRADFTAGRGSFTVSGSFEVRPGEPLAVIGPNGAGKSTLLDAVAGSIRVSEGEIRLSERTLSSGPPGPRTHVPAAARRIGYLAQRPYLFPHMSVLENAAFGPRSRGLRSADARAEGRAWLERVGMLDHAARRPEQLSGGQQQRVAIARALATDPAMLLLDEPLAALDATTAGDIRALLRDVIQQLRVPTLLVTHDAGDALTLATHALELADGRVVRTGKLREILAAATTRFVADFADLNRVPGVAETPSAVALDGAPLPRLECREHGLGHASPVWVSFPPEAVLLGADVEGCGARWVGTVEQLVERRRRIEFSVREWPGVRFECSAIRGAQVGLAPGEALPMALPSEQIRCAPRD